MAQVAGELSAQISFEIAQNRAVEEETNSNWLAASFFHRKTIDLLSPQDSTRIGEAYERSGYALYRAARQAETPAEFKQRVDTARALYHQALDHYEKTSDSTGKLRATRSVAMITLLSCWRTRSPSEKKQAAREAWTLAKKALKGFERAKDVRAYIETYSELATSVMLKNFFERDWRSSYKALCEAVQYGEKAIKLLSHFPGPDVARACAITSTFLDWTVPYLSDPELVSKIRNKADEYWKEAQTISEETALLSLSRYFWSDRFETGSNDSQNHLFKALELGEKTRDRLILGTIHDMLSYEIFWNVVNSEDPEKARELIHRAFDHALTAKQWYSPTGFPGLNPNLWPEAPKTTFYLALARLEVDPENKRSLLKQAFKTTPDYLRKAEISGQPGRVANAHHVLSRCLTSLARTEQRGRVKRRLLKAALSHRNEYFALCKRVNPLEYWDMGIGKCDLAFIKKELADLAQDRRSKLTLIRGAVADHEEGVRLCEKFLPVTKHSPPQVSWFARRQYEYGDLLVHAYDLTNGKKYLKKAAQTFQASSETYRKVSSFGRAAEGYWKAARAYSCLEVRWNAAECFNLASINYNTGAQKLLGLKHLYADYAIYMQVWSEFEQAKYHHSRREYSFAKKAYEGAASLLADSNRWNYLAPDFLAWAELENAEELSRNDQGEEAIKSFEKTCELFKETRKSIGSISGEIDNAGERKMARELETASHRRDRYCQARIAIEQARLFEKTGMNASSTEKYAHAVEILDELDDHLGPEYSRQVKVLRRLCKAWETMTRAEDRLSPELYRKASNLFKEARDASYDEKTRTLAQAYSHLCKAMEEGVRFFDSRRIEQYSSALGELERASAHYLRAGADNAYHYSKATKLLLDAYLYMYKAAEEPENQKRSRLFSMAVKVLEFSADSFSKSGYAAKREEVERLLDRAKKEQELAGSLAEILLTPPIFSPPWTPPSPIPTLENSAGLESFEHAEVKASLVRSPRPPEVGEDFNLQLELVNAGNGTAQLVKVEQVIPKGFDLKEKPEAFIVQDNHLALKGRRLYPLKTEHVKLVLRPKIEGETTLNPRIVYLDEDGNHRVCEPEPVSIVVRKYGSGNQTIEPSLALAPSEVLVGESLEARLDIKSKSQGPLSLKAVENLAPVGIIATSARGGFLIEDGRIELQGLKLGPSETHSVTVILTSTKHGKVSLNPTVVFGDESGSIMMEAAPAVEIQVHPVSPVLDYLAKVFVEDYLRKRLSFELAGWRGLMNIVRSLKIPRSQAYGETKYGRTFGRPLETLVRAGIVEYRIFPGKGRGGQVMRVRVCYDREPVKRLVDKLALTPIRTNN